MYPNYGYKKTRPLLFQTELQVSPFRGTQLCKEKKNLRVSLPCRIRSPPYTHHKPCSGYLSRVVESRLAARQTTVQLLANNYTVYVDTAFQVSAFFGYHCHAPPPPLPPEHKGEAR